MLPPWLIALLLLRQLSYSGYIYNRQEEFRNRIRDAWSGIGVQLKRQHDLIPNLATTVKAYAQNERDVLEELAELRSRVGGDNARETGKAEDKVTRSLKTLLRPVKAYPELKADKTFLRLQGDLVEIEDHLQYVRRYYNGAVRDMNTLAESFPSNLVCRMVNGKSEEFFEVTRAIERTVPSLSFAKQKEAGN